MGCGASSKQKYVTMDAKEDGGGVGGVAPPPLVKPVASPGLIILKDPGSVGDACMQTHAAAPVSGAPLRPGPPALPRLPDSLDLSALGSRQPQVVSPAAGASLIPLAEPDRQQLPAELFLEDMDPHDEGAASFTYGQSLPPLPVLRPRLFKEREGSSSPATLINMSEDQVPVMRPRSFRKGRV
eukprot:TRINITY_DN60136_c0_g1_i1.p1 TRINITY_DN60136_c0_g1~~TRINITY_DN60136_c0_g1_i1.p1  ORF type:complete len:183 (+),score=36.58 TRINITY_DN60136_c0_g1_i1:95-643(+)